MVHVNIADQMCLVYNFNVWLRNYKWWHAIFWLGVQVFLVNSYIVYKKVLTQAGLTPIIYYKYQKAIALGLIDLEVYRNKGRSYNTPPVDDMSTLTNTSTGTPNSKKKRVSDASLDPQEGNLKCRLAREYDPWPSTAIAGHNGTNPPCQPHCLWSRITEVD